MTGKRRTAVGRVSLTRRAHAREAIVRAWEATGWPRPPRSRSDYQRLERCMTSYVGVVFPELTEWRRLEIVSWVLGEIMAPLHAGEPAHGELAPEDLVRALEDAALDRATTPPPPPRSDEQVATLAFGVSPARVRTGLEGLAAEGRPVEFRMITRYLDLVDRARSSSWSPSPAEVVAGMGTGAATEQMARQALLDFRQRVKPVATDDAT